MKYFFLLLLPMILACQTFRNRQLIMQGISGLVYFQRGNMMPSPGRPVNKGKPAKIVLYVYAPIIAAQTIGAMPEFTKVNGQPIRIIKTTDNGAYSTNLPVGKYSVFIKDDKGFFANESDGNGIINPVEVFKGKVTQHNWVLARGAVY